MEINKIVSIQKAANLFGITRQAIYSAIIKNKLKVNKEKCKRWTIDLEDFKEYRRNLYSRKFSTFNGKIIFDNEKGLFSVKQVAKMLDFSVHRIYTLLKVNALKGRRIGYAWVIHIDDVEKFKSLNKINY